jgi:hypothetical protein
MNHPYVDKQLCGVCGEETSNAEAGLPLCYEHAAIARRIAALKNAKTDFDLIGSRSQGERNSNDGIGGRRTTYDIVPESDVERVFRDVQVEISDVPYWAVEYLFQHLLRTLGKPDIDDARATLHIRYETLDEEQYTRLRALEDHLWAGIDVEVVKVRLYPPEKLMKQKLREVDQEREKQDNRADSQSEAEDAPDVKQAS